MCRTRNDLFAGDETFVSCCPVACVAIVEITVFGCVCVMKNEAAYLPQQSAMLPNLEFAGDSFFAAPERPVLCETGRLTF